MFAKDYEYLINDSRARAIVVHESTLPEIEKIWDRTPFLKHVIVVGKPKGKALSFESLICQSVGPARSREDHSRRRLFLGLYLGQHGQSERRRSSAARHDHDQRPVRQAGAEDERKRSVLLGIEDVFLLWTWEIPSIFLFASAHPRCSGRKNPIRRKFFRSSTSTNRLSFSPYRLSSRVSCASKRNTT